MFLRKRFPSVKRREKRVKFNGFTAARQGKKGILAAMGGANCDLADGRILPGIGLKDYETSSGVSPAISASTDSPAVFAFLPCRDGNGIWSERVMYVSKRGLSYIYNDSAGCFEYARKVFTSRPAILPVYLADGSARLAFCSADGIFLYGETSGFVSVFASSSDAACVFHERLFFAEKPFTVRYSAPLDPSLWADSADESGFIDFPTDKGEIVALTVLKEAVYVFRKRGIEKLDAKGAARDFSHETLAYGGGNILGGSVGACGEHILFLAEDGLYAFDGRSAERVAEDMPIYPLCGGQGCEHGVFSGKYFLKYPDRDGTEKLLVWDEGTGSSYFSFASAGAFSETENRLLCFSDGKLRMAAADGGLPTGEEYGFFAENTDFGAGGRKVFKSLHLEGAGGCRVEIANDCETKSFEISFVRGRAAVKPALKGESFSLKIYLSDAASRVSGAEAVLDILG